MGVSARKVTVFSDTRNVFPLKTYTSIVIVCFLWDIVFLFAEAELSVRGGISEVALSTYVCNPNKIGESSSSSSSHELLWYVFFIV